MRRNNQLAIRDAHKLVGFAHFPYATAGNLILNAGWNMMVNYRSEKDKDGNAHFN